jgi:hypothetical protein
LEIREYRRKEGVLDGPKKNMKMNYGTIRKSIRFPLLGKQLAAYLKDEGIPQKAKALLRLWKG